MYNSLCEYLCSFHIAFVRTLVYNIVTVKETDRPQAGKEIDMVELAIAYAVANGNTEEARNDAANIYSNNYDEYMKIWTAINAL